jgi:hypothetical protein
MPGIDVALLGRGLVEAEVGSILERPDFFGVGGDLAEVVQVTGFRLQVTGFRLRVTGFLFRVTGCGLRSWVGVGADESIVIGADAVDGFALGLVAFEAGGSWEGMGRDLSGPDGGLGAGGVELHGKEAVDDLGHDQLDGGVVFEEGHRDVVLVGEGGMAVMEVGPAEVQAFEDDAVAAGAVGFDGAAVGTGLGHRDPGTGHCAFGLRDPGTGLRFRAHAAGSWYGYRLGGGRGDWFGHCDSFRMRAQSTGLRAQKTWFRA